MRLLVKNTNPLLTAMNKKETQQEIFQYAACFQTAIIDVLTNEDAPYYIKVQDDDITDIVTGAVLGFLNFIKNVAKVEGNYNDSLHMVDKILLAYLLKYGKHNEDDSD